MTRRGRSRRSTSTGQSVVEFALIVPVFLLLLLGLLEFGFAFDHTMTVSYATREGARSGAAYAAGNSTSAVCTTSVDVDKFIVAAVQRVLEAPGSAVAIDRIQEIRIYKSLSDGTQDGVYANVWTYNAGMGPQVDGEPLDFSPSSQSWNACTRDNDSTPDSLGVQIKYEYTFMTPLFGVLRFFGPGGAGISISDRTVMALNPTK